MSGIQTPLAEPAKQSVTGGHRKAPTMTTEQILASIAKKHLGIATLEIQRSDSLDFHDLAVWSIEAALKAAFEAGKQDAALKN
jgi:hypothetical protein